MKAPGTNEGRNTAPAFQGIGAVKVFLSKHVAALAEGKFIYASHNQEPEGTSIPLELGFTSVHGIGGLSFHFLIHALAERMEYQGPWAYPFF